MAAFSLRLDLAIVNRHFFENVCGKFEFRVLQIDFWVWILNFEFYKSTFEFACWILMATLGHRSVEQETVGGSPNPVPRAHVCPVEREGYRGLWGREFPDPRDKGNVGSLRSPSMKRLSTEMRRPSPLPNSYKLGSTPLTSHLDKLVADVQTHNGDAKKENRYSCRWKWTQWEGLWL